MNTEIPTKDYNVLLSDLLASCQGTLQSPWKEGNDRFTKCQGYNARKVISEVYASFVLSLGGNVNTRRMSRHDIGSIFHIKNQ